MLLVFVCGWQTPKFCWRDPFSVLAILCTALQTSFLEPRCFIYELYHTKHSRESSFRFDAKRP